LRVTNRSVEQENRIPVGTTWTSGLIKMAFMTLVIAPRDSERVLWLAEAAERLGFVVVDRRDMSETPLGETFAEASIQARKEIFATRVRRVPIVSWLLTMLQAADRHELETDVAQSCLGLEFPPEEAERQLAIAID
jgi:NitT/TauT family transport system ATP-binding protein